MQSGPLMHLQRREKRMMNFCANFVIGTASGVAILIDAANTAAPLLTKLAKRCGTVVVIEAVEIATKRVIALAGLCVGGMLAAWEATSLLLGLQLLVYQLTPNELENWWSRCAFGTAAEAIPRVTEGSATRYMDPSEQERNFMQAMINLL